jgi:hypothetical protein
MDQKDYDKITLILITLAIGIMVSVMLYWRWSF